jgi:hypothetical protein
VVDVTEQPGEDPDPTGAEYSDLADRLAGDTKPIPPDADVIGLGRAAQDGAGA